MSDVEKSRQDLFNLIKSEAYAEGIFRLSSGNTSNFYIDCRKITLSPLGAYLSACIILDAIKDRRVDAIGGPTIGADPIVGAVCVVSLLEQKRPLKGFLVRKAAKGHGLQRQIEGPALDRGSRVVVIDDVATTGQSLLDTISCLRENGLIIDCVIVLVDRNEGAAEKLQKAGHTFISIFRIEDFRSKK